MTQLVAGKALPHEYVEAGWCQNAAALNDLGDNVEARDKSATAWCATGAIEASIPADRHQEDAKNLLIIHVHQELRKRGVYGVLSWNDKDTQNKGAVVALLKSCATKYDWRIILGVKNEDA